MLGVVLSCAILAFANWGSDSPVPPQVVAPNEAGMSDREVAPSKAKELFIPSIELTAAFEDGSCRVKDGAINPATLDKACTYTAEDRTYSLPGSTAGDLVVIAGHTGAGVSAVFNKLYDGSLDQHKVHVGDRLFLKTEASGNAWLVYVATDLHSPQKEDRTSCTPLLRTLARARTG